MTLKDGAASFGWISIGLHWSGAILVIALLFVGGSIRTLDGALHDGPLRLHTTVALGFYLLLWFRIVWRFTVRHPGPLPKQRPFTYAVGRYFHYVLLIALVAMLVSGPLMAWAGGLPLRLWSWAIPSPFGIRHDLSGAAKAVHLAGAAVLGWGTLLHLAAVLKHTVIDRDGSLDRIIEPLEPSTPPL